MSLSRPKRRTRLSMTSLIDVIFLLLLFFMLSSTFSRFAEIELHVGGAGSASETPLDQTYFLRLAAGGMTLNGQPAEAESLPQRLQADAALILSVTETATAQGLADVLAALRAVPDLTLSVIGPG